ncbi:TonB family protein [Rhizobium sp.]
MSDLASHGDRLGQAGRLVVWLGAAAVVSAVYGFGIGWLMDRPVDDDGTGQTLPAIMIELADEPEAVDTEENVASVAEADAPDVKTEETKPQPDPVEEKVEPKPVEEKVEPEPQPVEEVAEPEKPEPVIEEPEVEPQVEEVKRELPPEPVQPVEEEDPIVEQVTKVLDNVAAPLPMMRPEVREVSEKPPEKKTEKRVERKKQRRQTASEQASKSSVKAEARVRQSNRNAAKTASESRADRASIAKWQSRVLSHLMRRKPSRSSVGGASGNVRVRFTIDSGGNVLSVSIASSSGSAELDRAAIAMVRNSSPVPAPPEGASKVFFTPVRFK